MLRRDKSCNVYQAIVTDIYKIEKEEKNLLGKVPAKGNCQPWGLYEISRQVGKTGIFQLLAGLTHCPTAPLSSTQ